MEQTEYYNNEPLLSVVIPVYDVEEYLPDCLQSISQQSWKNLQIILVDDGSLDDCGAICDRYAANDSRFEVIHQENKGLSAARNARIAAARGKILFFIDSDDYVDPLFCEKAARAMLRNDADIVCFGTRLIKPSGRTLKHYRFLKEQIITASEAIRGIIRGEILVDVWCKAFRRKLFDGLSFPIGYVSESTLIICQLIDRTSRIVTIPDITYNYRYHREGSICTVSS